jgi:hypothetical protein
MIALNRTYILKRSARRSANDSIETMSTKCKTLKRSVDKSIKTDSTKW